MAYQETKGYIGGAKVWPSEGVKKCLFPESVSKNGKTGFYPIVAFDERDTSRTSLCRPLENATTLTEAADLHPFVDKTYCLIQRELGTCVKNIPAGQKIPKI